MDDEQGQQLTLVSVRRWVGLLSRTRLVGIIREWTLEDDCARRQTQPPTGGGRDGHDAATRDTDEDGWPAANTLL